MLILGGRYGSIEPQSQKSYTQIEYEYALSKDIPVFAVVLNNNYLKSKTNTIEKDEINKYKTFKKLVMSKTIREVNDCKDIKLAVYSTLNEFINTYNFVGWCKSEQLNTMAFANNWKEQFYKKTHLSDSSYVNTLLNQFGKIANVKALLHSSINNIELQILDDSASLYTFVGSTFSSFSEIQYDDFNASEMYNINSCTIELPPWSLPGSGYAITLKKKSPENHV